MDEEGISMEEFKSAFEKGNMFASGIAVDYGASVIVAKAGNLAEQGDGTAVESAGRDDKDRVVGKQDLASNIKMGMRMPSLQVLNQADARPSQFQEPLHPPYILQVANPRHILIRPKHNHAATGRINAVVLIRVTMSLMIGHIVHKHLPIIPAFPLQKGVKDFWEV